VSVLLPLLVFEDDASAFHHRAEDPALPARLLAPTVSEEELTTELRVRGERHRQGTQAQPQGKGFMAEQDPPERLTQVSVRAKRLPGDRRCVRDEGEGTAHGGKLLEIGQVTGLEAWCAAAMEKSLATRAAPRARSRRRRSKARSP
jgi:hypothetical protein